MPLFRTLRERPGPALLLGLGGALLLLLHLGVDRFELVNRFFYPLVWWSFILTLDAFNGLRGRSVLLGRSAGFVLRCAGFSMTLWFVFEVYNLRLANWYYVGTSPSPFLHGALTAVSFATVLPGMWTVRRCLGRELLTDGRPGPALSPGRGVTRALILGGALACVLPFLWPRWTFPLIWLGPGLVVDGLEHRRGAPSFLGDLEAGRYEPLLAWLLAGGVCGLLWEAWNSLTVTHWIYTVPFLEDWRLFEMPPVGYLGFLPFAPATWRLYTALRGLYRRRSRAWKTGFWAAALAFGCLSLTALQHHTVASRYPDLQDFVGWTPEQRKLLQTRDLHSPWRALRTLRDPALRRKIEYLRFAGIGTDLGNCLWVGGVRTVASMRSRPVDELAGLLRACRGGSRTVWRRRVLDWRHRAPIPRVRILPRSGS